MQFLIMVLSNPTSLAHWDTMTDVEKQDFGPAHFALTESLLDSGHLVSSAALAPAEMATQVSARNGVITATDGPFAEVKEHLAGFYLVECADIAEAVTIAARVPDAAFSHVEIRPIYDPKLYDSTLVDE